MKPAKFDYHAPSSLAEALAVLGRCDGEARLLAGGQSLVPMMNFRLAQPAAIVDLNRIAALAFIEAEREAVRIGAMTRQRAIERSPLIAEKLPLLREAVSLIGHLPIRARGTIGGSLANADPAAELPMALLALDGEVVAESARGARRIAAAELFLAPLETALADDEILVEVRFPAMPAAAGYAVEEFARRQGDFAIAAIAAVVVGDGAHCRKARLATAGIGPVPVRLRNAEAVLEREGLGEAAIAAAAAKAAEEVEPVCDRNGSADYRRHLTAVLARRALLRAGERARG